jgi:hypothetical protein
VTVAVSSLCCIQDESSAASCCATCLCDGSNDGSFYGILLQYNIVQYRCKHTSIQASRAFETDCMSSGSSHTRACMRPNATSSVKRRSSMRNFPKSRGAPEGSGSSQRCVLASGERISWALWSTQLRTRLRTATSLPLLSSTVLTQLLHTCILHELQRAVESIHAA